jgi:hypothetical protein
MNEPNARVMNEPKARATMDIFESTRRYESWMGGTSNRSPASWSTSMQ